RLSVYRDLIAEGVLSHLANIEPRDEEKVYRLTASSAYRSDASIPAADISAEGTSASSGAARPLSRRRHQRASKHADRSPDIGKLLDAALRHPLVSTILGGLVVAAIAAAVTVLV
ncbi:MAG: hypothetical protein ACRED5_20755, partial [Propylenella sp.]